MSRNLTERRRCSAKSKTTGEQCRNPPMRGAKTCRFHGSGNARSKAAAKRNRERAAAAAAVVTYGLPRVIDPAEALLEEVHRTAGHVAWLQAAVAEFDAAALSWGLTSSVSKTSGEFPGIDTTESAAPPVLLELYLRERKHLVDVAKAALAAGIDERRVRLAETQGLLIVRVINAILDDLHLTARQRVLVGTVVPRHLRAIDPGEIPA